MVACVGASVGATSAARTSLLPDSAVAGKMGEASSAGACVGSGVGVASDCAGTMMLLPLVELVELGCWARLCAIAVETNAVIAISPTAATPAAISHILFINTAIPSDTAHIFFRTCFVPFSLFIQPSPERVEGNMLYLYKYTTIHNHCLVTSRSIQATYGDFVERRRRYDGDWESVNKAIARLEMKPSYGTRETLLSYAPTDIGKLSLSSNPVSII